MNADKRYIGQCVMYKQSFIDADGDDSEDIQDCPGIIVEIDPKAKKDLINDTKVDFGGTAWWLNCENINALD